LLLAQARGLPQASLLQVEVRHGALVTLQVENDGSLQEPG
jgi:alpha-ribazole phosphatase